MQLSNKAYWRIEDKEILITDGNNALRLNHNVRQVFLNLRKLVEYLPKLQDALNKTEEKINNLNELESARQILNAITIRLIPFVVLRNLCLQARLNQEINFQYALPSFLDDKNQKYDLNGFLEYALH